jgi:hypothetical protein
MKVIIVTMLVAVSTNFAHATEALKCTTLSGKSMQLAFSIATGSPDDDEKIASFTLDGQSALEQISKYNFNKGVKSLTLRNGARFNIVGQKVTQMSSSGQFLPISCTLIENIIH